MALFNIVVHNHYYTTQSAIQNGNPVPPPEKKSEEGKSKSGLNVTILDIFIGAGLATVQSIWNTPMLALVISWLHMAGFAFLPLWATTLLATFLIGLFLCALTPVVRRMLGKLFS
ncbi:MAG: hypothetical protein RR068_00365 [Hafnia sp.]